MKERATEKKKKKEPPKGMAYTNEDHFSPPKQQNHQLRLEESQYLKILNNKGMTKTKRDRQGSPQWQKNRGHKTIFESKRMIKAGEQGMEGKVPQPIIN